MLRAFLNLKKKIKSKSYYFLESSNYIEYESNGYRNKNYQLKNILIKLDHT